MAVVWRWLRRPSRLPRRGHAVFCRAESASLQHAAPYRVLRGGHLDVKMATSDRCLCDGGGDKCYRRVEQMPPNWTPLTPHQHPHLVFNRGVVSPGEERSRPLPLGCDYRRLGWPGAGSTAEAMHGIKGPADWFIERASRPRRTADALLENVPFIPL